MLDQLDHSAITAHYQGEERGGPPYHLGTIVKVMVCGCRTGVGCSRRIAKRLHENIPFRVLAANNTPDFRNISDFRKDHLKALADLFQQSYNYQAVVDSECQVIVAASHQCRFGQTAGGGQGGGDHPEHRSDAQGTFRRRRLLLGQGGGGTLRPGSGPTHRAGEDPPRREAGAGAPGPDTPRDCRPGTGCGGSCGRNGGANATRCG